MSQATNDTAASGNAFEAKVAGPVAPTPPSNPDITRVSASAPEQPQADAPGTSLIPRPNTGRSTSPARAPGAMRALIDGSTSED
jgi:hypothetical protein